MAKRKARQIVVEFTQDAPRITTALRDLFIAHAMRPRDKSLAESKTKNFFVQWLFVEAMASNGSHMKFIPIPGMKFSWEEGGDKIVIRDKENILRAWFWARYMDGIRHMEM